LRSVINVGPGEEQLAELVVQAAGNSRPIPFTGSLGQLMALLKNASALVAGDTGPMHLADVLGTRVIAIFGPTDPARTVIPGATRVVRKDVSCGPCYERECPMGHHRCMTEISVDEVYTAAVGLLQEVAASEVRVL